MSFKIPMQNSPEKQNNTSNRKYLMNTSNIIHTDHFRLKKKNNPCSQ